MNTLAQSDKAYGGHGCLATTRNVMQADTSEMLFKRMITNMMNGVPTLVIHVGSKFMKMHNLWQEVVRQFLIALAREFEVPELTLALEAAQKKGKQITLPTI